MPRVVLSGFVVFASAHDFVMFVWDNLIHETWCGRWDFAKNRNRKDHVVVICHIHCSTNYRSLCWNIFVYESMEKGGVTTFCFLFKAHMVYFANIGVAVAQGKNEYGIDPSPPYVEHKTCAWG